MRTALAAGAWIEHEPGFVGPGEADGLLAALGEEMAWEQREIVLFGRPVLQPRLIAWAGDLGYRYSGQTLPPRAFTPAAGGLLTRICERVGVPFNHVLANRYRTGADSMGFHADDEAELGRDPVVAIVSLGTPRRFVLKPRRASLGEGQSLALGLGSLLVMGGTCQRHYVHGVPRQAGVAGERISLTVRWLHRAP
ncbi:MAG TPA: alpha-ketoglutarate-dependent dioxygenase AlkB [Candidatus Limnocylindrales bacterium]|nr:alpha-ketoglutarate-dependent dioxygenase AlkB [Candidatus Limnocylindrales bacterium]